jgi:hypothetical protein
VCTRRRHGTLNAHAHTDARTLSQKMAQKEPEKKMPSMAAYATRRVAKELELQWQVRVWFVLVVTVRRARA